MARRRRKKSPFSTLAWLLLAAIPAAWGLWQANELRKSILLNQSGPLMASAAVLVNDSKSIDAMNPDELAPPIDDKSHAAVGGVSPAVPPAMPARIKIIDSPRLMAGHTFSTSLSSDDLFTQGKTLLNAGNLVAARYALNASLERCRNEGRAQEIRNILAPLNQPVFLGNAILPNDPAARLITIQEGDLFLKLGKEFGVPAAFLQSINPSLNARNLKPGSGAKIVQGPFAINIIKHAGRLDLFARELYVCSFPADFPEGNSLPTGDYRVIPGTKLQLAQGGAKTWIGFEGIEPGTEQVTAGWIFGSSGPRGNSARDHATGIRLADSDLLEVYNVLAEGKSRVRVLP